MFNCDEFLGKYLDVILNEHKEKIMFYHAFLNKYKNVEKVFSIHGCHFIICPWAQNNTTSGPDTCGCCYVDSYEKQLMNLVNWYENNVKNADSIQI